MLETLMFIKINAGTFNKKLIPSHQHNTRIRNSSNRNIPPHSQTFVQNHIRFTLDLIKATVSTILFVLKSLEAGVQKKLILYLTLTRNV